jgi:transcriptional regulator with XRE-family HTH domain
MATISQNIKRIRAKQGLTQDDLAKKANIKYSTLTKIEGGVVTKPSVQTIQKIAKSLGVPMEDLLK